MGNSSAGGGRMPGVRQAMGHGMARGSVKEADGTEKQARLTIDGSDKKALGAIGGQAGTAKGIVLGS